MSEEKRIQIEQLAKRTGLSFIDAQRMLEDIETDGFDFVETMAEMWY